MFQAVYGELRRLAKRALRSERPDHTLQPTALVHEAYIRLLGGGSGSES
ncbi:MAG TPA: ECF-type sigma factor [Bryobacteraceae bacterium]|nr:ECF-type sigma factor [Bryobacteraceae bacterium]